MLKKILKRSFPIIDGIYLNIDKGQIRRTKNLRLIPGIKHRRGGKISYAEWSHVIGIFQTVIYQNLMNKTGNKILDIGCGTGLLGISSEPFTTNGGSYTGIDIMKPDIYFCNNHYKLKNYNFLHVDLANPSYSK